MRKEPTRIAPSWAGFAGSSSPKEVRAFASTEGGRGPLAACPRLEGTLVFSWARAGPRRGTWPGPCRQPATRVGLSSLDASAMVVSGIIRVQWRSQTLSWKGGAAMCPHTCDPRSSARSSHRRDPWVLVRRRRPQAQAGEEAFLKSHFRGASPNWFAGKDPRRHLGSRVSTSAILEHLRGSGATSCHSVLLSRRRAGSLELNKIWGTSSCKQRKETIRKPDG